MVDSVASIAYFLGEDDFAHSWRAKLLLGLTPKGAVYVYVDADYDTILKRRGFAAGPREYTEFHRRLYAELCRKVGAFYIDTSKNTVAAANQKILDFISSTQKTAHP
jgi:deoxyadenosine/deoxycytidine kinase